MQIYKHLILKGIIEQKENGSPNFGIMTIFGSGAAESPISHLGRTAARVKSILKLPRLVDTKNAVL